MKIKDVYSVEAKEINLVEDPRFELFKKRQELHKNEAIPAFCLYINEHAWKAFEEFANEAHAQKGHEASGILLGQYFKDEHGEFVVAHQFEPGNGESTNETFCEISYDDMARINTISKESGLIQVVWIHSHPGFTAFYSSRDSLTLKTYFNQQFQRGIVLDNINKEYKVFKSENEKVTEQHDMWVYSPEESTLAPPYDNEADEPEDNNEEDKDQKMEWLLKSNRQIKNGLILLGFSTLLLALINAWVLVESLG